MKKIYVLPKDCPVFVVFFLSFVLLSMGCGSSDPRSTVNPTSGSPSGAVSSSSPAATPGSTGSVAVTSLPQVNTVYLFPTTATFQGNFLSGVSQRLAADAYCAASFNAHSWIKANCSIGNTHALISLSATDTIANMPTAYNFTTKVAVFADNDTQLAYGWQQMITGPYSHTLNRMNPTLYPSGATYWTGTDAAGGYNSDQSCSGWTDNQRSQLVGGKVVHIGTEASSYYAGASSVIFDWGGSCDDNDALLCICW